MKAVVVFTALFAVAAAAVVPDPIVTRPGPTAPIIKPETRYEVVDFPNAEFPYLRFHINIKDDAGDSHVINRAIRSILPLLPGAPPSLLPSAPPSGPAIDPIAPPPPAVLPEVPQVPSLPGLERPLPPPITPGVPLPTLPEIEVPAVPNPPPRPMPPTLPGIEIPAPIEPEIPIPPVGPLPPVKPEIPEISPLPETPVEETNPLERIFTYPSLVNPLVRMRVKVNSLVFEAPVTKPGRHLSPKPMPIPTKRTPNFEVFLDIGKPTKY